VTGKNPALAVTYWEPTVGTRLSVSRSQVIATLRTEARARRNLAAICWFRPVCPMEGKITRGIRITMDIGAYFINCSARVGSGEPRKRFP